MISQGRPSVTTCSVPLAVCCQFLPVAIFYHLLASGIRDLLSFTTCCSLMSCFCMMPNLAFSCFLPPVSLWSQRLVICYHLLLFSVLLLLAANSCLLPSVTTSWLRCPLARYHPLLVAISLFHILSVATSSTLPLVASCLVLHSSVLHLLPSVSCYHLLPIVHHHL